MNSKRLISKHIILQQEKVIWKNTPKKVEIKNMKNEEKMKKV